MNLNNIKTESLDRKPLVSIIIIFFNAKIENFFEEAIESIFAQTFDNWELLLADDGSTDESTAVALRYAQKYPEKVRYLEHEGHQNRGMSATRNLGIRHAKGDYIAFLDADDLWLPKKLEQQVAIMESHPEAGMVYGRSQYWYSWTGKPEDAKGDFVDQRVLAPDHLYQPPKLLLHNHPLGKASAPCPSDFLLRKKFIEQVGGFEEGFIKEYQFYEDQGFLSKLYLVAPIYISSQTWIKYRIHSNSCSSKVKESRKEERVRLYFLHWFKKYLTERGVKDPEIWQALQKQLWSSRYPILSKLTKRAKGFVGQMKALVKWITQRIFLGKL